MTDLAAARRLRILEEVAENQTPQDLTSYAEQFAVDERAIRRDLDFLQTLLASVKQVGLHRGKIVASREGIGPGYFSDQVEKNSMEKQAIAVAVVNLLKDNVAVALTAGSTTYHVARELRRAHVNGDRPKNTIVFTNSIPALSEMITAGISTGVLGEVYNADDCAFHAHEFRSAFQASVAIVGASGAVANTTSGSLDLFSHRAEEAAFMKQLLAPIPEIIVVTDSDKIGNRHPWAYTNANLLAMKKVKLVTTTLTEETREDLIALTESARKIGCSFEFIEVDINTNLS